MPATIVYARRIQYSGIMSEALICAE
jgi:hypothetical protein